MNLEKNGTLAEKTAGDFKMRRFLIRFGTVALFLTTEAQADCLQVNGVTYYQASLVKPNYACVSSGNIQRFEVHSRDRGWSGDADNGNERSEIVTTHILDMQKQYLIPAGVDAWVSYAFRVITPPPTSGWAFVGQYHSKSDPWDKGQGALENFLLDVAPGGGYRLSLYTRSDPNWISTTGARGVLRWSTPIQPGRWVRIVLRSRFDPTGGGALQLWVDGKQQLLLTNIPIGYNNVVSGGYWQYGIYRSENPSPLIVEYANMEQGRSSLIDRVENPIALR